ncbi:PREDICTED: putative defensin-like protein 270 [Camelina sativa]|uniref:Defensin-like protein 270 n=1 Tax=Camelina sativa TaxID=90675 RepID=A0ABM1QNX3_CAMSA|nr:PREDICTED: putative defensin-like protein 270 [Camelina sativa]
MAPSKCHFVAFLLIISLVVNIQSIWITDDSSDYMFKGPRHRREDCYKRCGVKPPSHAALCVPLGDEGLVCCCL